MRVAIIAVFVAAIACANLPGHNQKPCDVNDEREMVEVREVIGLALDGACFELRYADQKGHLCVFAKGTPERPFVATTQTFDPKLVSDRGWTGGGHVYLTAKEGYEYLCKKLVNSHRLEHERTLFDPDEASEFLDRFFERTAGSEPLSVGAGVQGVTTVPSPQPIFTKVDPDFEPHMAVCGDRLVADVPPPEPPPRTLRRELRSGGSMGGARLMPMVYTWTPFDPYDDSYDTHLVWLDGEGNYWCAMSPWVSAHPAWHRAEDDQ